MLSVTQDLPQDRVIIGGLGSERHLHSIERLWPGLLAYHAYPQWLPPEHRTHSEYSELVQRSLHGLGHRVYVTEFGSNVAIKGEDYSNLQSTSCDVQFLNGLQEAFSVVRPLGTCVWHGWDNGDCYSYWAATDSARALLDRIQNY